MLPQIKQSIIETYQRELEKSFEIFINLNDEQKLFKILLLTPILQINTSYNHDTFVIDLRGFLYEEAAKLAKATKFRNYGNNPIKVINEFIDDVIKDLLKLLDDNINNEGFIKLIDSTITILQGPNYK